MADRFSTIPPLETKPLSSRVNIASSTNKKLFTQDELDRQTLDNYKKTKEDRQNRIKTAWGRPVKYAELISRDIELQKNIFNTKLEKNQALNQLEFRLETDNEYTTQEYNSDRLKVGVGFDFKIFQLEKELQSVKDEINQLDDNFFGLINPDRERRTREDRRKVREARKRERKKRAKTKTNLKDQILIRWRNEPNKLRSVVNGVSFIANTYLQLCGANNGKIEILVDETIAIIENIETFEDIENAKIQRDLALLTIKLNEDYLEKLNILLNTIGVLNQILNGIIALLQLLPPPLYSPKVEAIIKKIDQVLQDLTGLFTTATFLINVLLEDLNFQRSRLIEIGSILDSNLEGLSIEEIQSLIGDGLGYLSGYDYKDFKFYIKEEENPAPEFIIKGNKRRYAVAVDTVGIERLRSEFSFTLNPDVLVEQLKLEIDKQNLVA